MKKLLFLMPVILLIAAACNNEPTQQTKQQNNNQQQSQPSPTNQQGSTDQKTSWKTYTSAQYGYEFKYPSNWAVTDHGSTMDSVNKILSDISVVGDGQSFAVRVDQNAPQGFVYTSPKKATVTVNGTQYTAYIFPNGYECYGDTPSDCSLFIIPIQKGNQWYLISGAGKASSITETYSSILATFKFTGTAQNSDWKIYKNSQYGFQITLSDAFKGYSVTKKVHDYYGSDYFTFIIPSSGLSPQVNVEALTILTIPLNTWNSITKDPESMPLGTVLGKNSKYVFLAQLPQDGAGLPASLLKRGDGSEMWAIMSSFKFIK